MMQSFLQYWKIRERLERQQEQQQKDLERTGALSVLEEEATEPSDEKSIEVTRTSDLSTWETKDDGKLDLESGQTGVPAKRVCLVPKARPLQHLHARLSSDDNGVDGRDSRPPTPPPKNAGYKPKPPGAPRPPRPPKRLRIRTGPAQSQSTTPPHRPPPPFAPPPPPPQATASSSSLNLQIQLTHHPPARPSTYGDANALGVLLSGITVQAQPSAADGKVFVVEHEDSDPLDPHTWSVWSRIAATLLIGGIAFVVGVASSINSAVVKEVARDFGVSEEVARLATGRYLVGLGIGALFSGPCSETLGRNPVYVGTLSLYMLCIAAAGLAPNAGAQIAFRFLAGFFGSTPLTCAGGSIADLWSPLDRVYAFPVFANAAFMGPVLGPILGSFIATSPHVTWRMVEWTSLLLALLILTLLTLFQPETYSPVLLRWKAHHLRQLTHDARYVSAPEARGDTFGSRLRAALIRPFVLTATEPIIGLIGVYLTVVYVVLFMFLDGFDYVFGRTYGTSQVVTGFCFAGIAVGLFGATALAPLVYRWAKRGWVWVPPPGTGAAGTGHEKSAGHQRQNQPQQQPQQQERTLPPEFRLWYAMLGGSIAIPLSLLWMGLTASPRIPIWSPLAASALFGYGILTVFISSYLYIIDTYATLSASALASVTLVRYVAAGAMVSVGGLFYENVGVRGTLGILAGVSAVLAPLPYVFYFYGERIRGRSAWVDRG